VSPPDCGFIGVVQFEIVRWFLVRPARRRSERDPMARQCLQIHYSGRVQGVGFRYTVKSLASGFEVTGTVRNLADGRVTLVAEGERSELDAFAGAIRASELGYFIRQEEVEWGEAGHRFHGFEIVR
jgi:acylphosphatase